MGAIMDATTANQLSKFKDEMELIGRVIEAAIAPALVEFGKVVYEIISELGALGTGIGSLMAVLWDIIRHPLDFARGKGTFKNFSEGHESVKDDVKNYLDERQKMFDDIFNKKPEKIIPPAVTFEPVAEKEKKEKGERMLSSDSLISVGNFLGSGGREINNLAQQQINISMQQLGVLEDIKATLDKTPADNGVEYD